ncbi:restriction endonuclease subunit S [Taibaiella soli]|uniref:Type I restriction modification DNA specificity domain-containing protein n=1 Tax=Taibaiella soli TaxID=1649169 RepID=A0A2W2AE51_9BACT|nr:restriction endonuclease subunit S [Taibaiella soli]PZF73561.1 hypothetical protein DN068_07510 [Taibaiella soli]
MKHMQTETVFKYLNEVRFKTLSNWSAGTILSNKILYKDGFNLEPIRNLILRNREREILEDDKAYKQVTIKLYSKGVVQRGDELVLGKNIGTKTQFRISQGQFIMSKIDARNGAFGIVPAELEGAITTQDFLSYNINTERILPDFFNLITGTRHFAELCQRASSGTTGRQRVDENAFLEFRIPVPSIKVQKEICSEFETNMSLANEAEELANNHVESLKGIFEPILKIKNDENKGRFSVYSFTDLDRWDLWNRTVELKSNYPLKKMSQLIKSINTGTTPPTTKKHYFEPGEVNFFTPVDLGTEKYLVQAERKISLKAIEDKKARVFEKGTLLFVGIGSSIGKIGIVAEQFACSNQQITGFLIDTHQALTEYVYYYFKMFKEITTLEKTQATLPIINQEKINNIPIPLPPMEFQEQLVKSIDEIENKIAFLKNASENSKKKAKEQFESAIFNTNLQFSQISSSQMLGLLNSL